MTATPIFIKETRRHDQNVTDFYLDHLVIIINDLEEAVRDYRSLGFTVESPREAGDGGLQRARILFADPNRTYLELISLPQPWIKRVARVLQGAGLFNPHWARSGAMSHCTLTRVTRLEGAGDVSLPHTWIGPGLAGAETRGASPQSLELAPKTAQNGVPRYQRHSVFGRDSFLPLVTAYTPPHQRLPRVPEDEAATQHANGVTGVATITIAVKDSDRSVVAYRALLGLEPCHQLASPLLSLRTVSFSLGSTTLRLAQPTGTGALKDYLKERGEGPCALMLRTTAGTKRLDDARTHGMRIELINN